MALSGTPHQGRDNIIAPRVYVNCQLILYTNESDSLDDNTVLADLNQPTGTGYAPIELNGTWSSVEGVVTYDHGTPDDPAFLNTGESNWSLPVTGAAIISGSDLLHFKDSVDGAGAPVSVTMSPGMKFVVDLSNLVAP